MSCGKELKQQFSIFKSSKPLPDNKILAMSKLKAFADNNFNLCKITKFVQHRLEKNVRRGENAGNQHFLQFPKYFPKAFSPGALQWSTELYSVRKVVVDAPTMDKTKISSAITYAYLTFSQTSSGFHTSVVQVF